MGLAILKTATFGSEEDLCKFVNANQISVIEQIVVKNGIYVLFYRR